jgi:uncharacterized protein YcfJ
MTKDVVTALVVVAASLGPLFLSGCASDAQVGSAVGVLAGASIGQIAGGDTESTLIGAAVGGVTGYMLGNESDKMRAQAERAHICEDMRYVTVHITNSNGSISRVRLRKYGVGYVGTRGEYYNRLPTEDQLRPVYGF